MEAIGVFHMNGGVGDGSYSSNSLLQREIISMTKPIREKAMRDLYISGFSKILCMAELGCSSGTNTLLMVSELIETVDMIRLKLCQESPEIIIYLNDLPGNDFNTMFPSLSKFQENLKKQTGLDSRRCFINAVPGSFYDRLFASKSLHFVHSSSSLHWLSQTPKGIENNKGNIYMSSTSPPNVLKSYYEQFQKDFGIFIKCRSEEMVEGGIMVLTLVGRKSDDPSSKECCYLWELIAMALNEMISEGIIEEEKMESFNVPYYTPSPKEVKQEVEKEGSFTIDRLEVSEVNWNASDNDFNASEASHNYPKGYYMAKCMRAVTEPMLASHFGKSIIDEVFARYMKIITDRMSREEPKLYNVTVSMTRVRRAVS